MVARVKGSFKLEKRSATGVVWLPADLVKDSAFPLKVGPVEITIEKDRLVIKQARA